MPQPFKTPLLLALLALLAAAGCTSEADTSVGAELDAGDPRTPTASQPDASHPELEDVEVWMPPDAGQRDNPDPTVPGARDAGGRVCAPLLVSVASSDEPACSAETGACVVACESEPDDDQEGCRDACSAQDTYDGELECSGCITLRLLACFNARGCSTDELFCCLESKCGVGGADGCVDAMCQPELQGLFSCVTGNSAALGCFDFRNGPASSCFAASSAPADAGT